MDSGQSFLSVCYLRTQQEVGHLKDRKKGPSLGNQISQHLDFGFPFLHDCEKEILLFKPPNLWYFVMAV